MTSRRVRDLTAADALTGDEVFYADNGSTDVKVTASQIRAFSDPNVIYVDDYGAVGDGITLDDDAVTEALDAGRLAGKPVVFSSGKTYLFGSETYSGTLQDNDHIIIEKGATCKQAPDGGVATFGGVFYLAGADIFIENYGTIDGNASGMTADYTASTYHATIQTFELDCINFVYDDHGTGLITNSAFGAFNFVQATAPKIRSANITLCNLNQPWIGAASIWFQGTPGASAHHIRISDSPAWGCRVIGWNNPPLQGTEDEAIHFDDWVVDQRGLDIAGGSSNSSGCMEINNTYSEGTDPIMAGISVSNIVFFGPDTVGTPAPSITAGLSIGHPSNSPMTISNIQILGSGVDGTINYGIEIGNQATLTGIIIQDVDTGILCQSSCAMMISAIIRRTLHFGIQSAIGGDIPMMLDLILEDCGTAAVSNDGIFLQDLVGAPCAVIKVHAIYSNIDADRQVIWASGAGRVMVHDSFIQNNMAGSREVKMRFDASAAVTNSTFIGKADTGTAIVMNGTGNRIIGNHFKDYNDPWDSNAGTNTLIALNIAESCTDANGETDGTDTLASNISF